MKKIFAQLESNPLYKKYELYVIPAITITLLIGMILLIVVPNIFQYFDVEKNLLETNTKIAFFQQKKSNLQSVNKDEYTKGINNSLVILPGDSEPPSAISQLYHILGLTNMQVQNIAFSDSGNDKGGKSFKISLELNGSFSELTNFIIKLKEAPRLMRIHSLEVSSPSSSTNVYTSIVLNAYYEPLPKNISNLDQPLAQISDKDLEILNKLQNTGFPIVSEEIDYSGPKGKPNPFE
jgi:Tfp pilus assembly protein PilO